jgi:hypothetical protein
MKFIEINKQALVEAIAKENTSGIDDELVAEAVEVANNPTAEWNEHTPEEMMARYK